MNRSSRFSIFVGVVVGLLLTLNTEPPCRGQDDAKNLPRGVIIKTTKQEPSKKSNVIAECLVKIKHKDFPNGEVRVRVKETKLEKVVDGKRRPAKFEDLMKGSQVEFSGYDEILESLPPIVYPRLVVILEGKK